MLHRPTFVSLSTTDNQKVIYVKMTQCVSHLNSMYNHVSTPSNEMKGKDIDGSICSVIIDKRHQADMSCHMCC